MLTTTSASPSGADAEWPRYWPLVLAALDRLLIHVVHAPGHRHLHGPLEQEFGWSRTELPAASRWV
jgi:hypothetical protein